MRFREDEGEIVVLFPQFDMLVDVFDEVLGVLVDLRVDLAWSEFVEVFRVGEVGEVLLERLSVGTGRWGFVFLELYHRVVFDEF